MTNVLPFRRATNLVINRQLGLQPYSGVVLRFRSLVRQKGLGIKLLPLLSVQNGSNCFDFRRSLLPWGVVIDLFLKDSIQTTPSRRQVDVRVEPNVWSSKDDGVVARASVCSILHHQAPHRRHRPISPKHVPGDRRAGPKNTHTPKHKQCKIRRRFRVVLA